MFVGCFFLFGRETAGKKKTGAVCFQLEFGVVYSCLEDKMYKARRGKGAFCNDDPIQVSDVSGESCYTRLPR